MKRNSILAKITEPEQFWLFICNSSLLLEEMVLPDGPSIKETNIAFPKDKFVLKNRIGEREFGILKEFQVPPTELNLWPSAHCSDALGLKQ